MNLDAIDLLKQAVTKGASDIFIVAGLPVSMRLQGNIMRIGEERLLPDDTYSVISQIYEMAGGRSMDILSNGGRRRFFFCNTGPFPFSRQRLQTKKYLFHRRKNYYLYASGSGRAWHSR